MTGSIGILLNTKTEVECAHCTLCDIVDFSLQEGIERTVHSDIAARLAIEIHTSGEHCDSHFASFLHTHSRELVLNRHVVGSIERELQSHVVESLCHFHSTVERHTSTASAFRRDESFYALGSSEIESRIHHVARKLHITALSDGECLERNHRQLIFHLSVIDGISSEELHSVEVGICHSQFSTALNIHIVRLVGIKETSHSRSLFNIHHQEHVESTDSRSGLLNHTGSVAEVGECDKFTESVARVQWRIAQDISYISRTQNIESSSHVKSVERSLDERSEIDERLTVGKRFG